MEFSLFSVLFFILRGLSCAKSEQVVLPASKSPQEYRGLYIRPFGGVRGREVNQGLFVVLKATRDGRSFSTRHQ